MSFGIRFGQLVREKRAIEGLTQEALAFKAFGDEDRKTRVSELECGTVNKPHARTVDALVVALSITPEELAACRQPAPATTVDEPQPSPAATPPAPVLTAQPLFVGREDLLGRIDAACAHSEGAVIQSIQGMGGVGKTALARQAAKRFAEKGLTPDGQVFVNLRGWNSGQRMSTADALRSLCTQLDRNIDQTYSEEQLAAHWRGLTRGKRLVVILDNAADAAQVEALRPTDGITLITTRRLGLIRGIGTVDVDVMREGDAAELAQRLCPGLDEERARRLSKAVGYLPLAIEIAAGRLADGVEALEALEAKLIDSVKALDLLEELREVLSFSLAGLTDEQVATVGGAEPKAAGGCMTCCRPATSASGRCRRCGRLMTGPTICWRCGGGICFLPLAKAAGGCMTCCAPRQRSGSPRTWSASSSCGGAWGRLQLFG